MGHGEGRPFECGMGSAECGIDRILGAAAVELWLYGPRRGLALWSGHLFLLVMAYCLSRAVRVNGWLTGRFLPMRGGRLRDSPSRYIMPLALENGTRFGGFGEIWAEVCAV